MYRTVVKSEPKPRHWLDESLRPRWLRRVTWVWLQRQNKNRMAIRQMKRWYFMATHGLRLRDRRAPFSGLSGAYDTETILG